MLGVFVLLKTRGGCAVEPTLRNADKDIDVDICIGEGLGNIYLTVWEVEHACKNHHQANSAPLNDRSVRVLIVTAKFLHTAISTDAGLILE